MTNTEKFLLKEKDAKTVVMSILTVFDGKSYKFANAALNAAKTFLNEESQFKAGNAMNKIAALTDEEAKPAPKVAPKKKQ